MKTQLWMAAAAVAVGLSAQPAHAQTLVTCESRGEAREMCAAGNVAGVSLRRQLSTADCIRGRTWGFTSSAIWVARGCRAEFQVTQGNNGAGSGRYGRNDDNNRRNDRYDDNGKNDTRNWNAINAASACRRAVQSQLGRRVRVNVESANSSRNNPRLNWTASNGRSGSCRLDRNDNLTVSYRRRG